MFLEFKYSHLYQDQGLQNFMSKDRWLLFLQLLEEPSTFVFRATIELERKSIQLLFEERPVQMNCFPKHKHSRVLFEQLNEKYRQKLSK